MMKINHITPYPQGEPTVSDKGAVIMEMVDQLPQNPDVIASIQLSSSANWAVQCLIQTLILIKDSIVVDFILRNARHPITTLCDMGQEGLISTNKTIGLATKKIASSGAGVYVWSVETKDACLQYIGSTHFQPYRFHTHVGKFLGKGELQGMYKYVREHQLHSSCTWNEVYSTLNFTREFMLAHPNVRLRPLELLALDKMTELVPRILERSLLSHPGRALGFNGNKGVAFYYNKRITKAKYFLVDRETKGIVSPPLYTERQVGYLLGLQKPYSIHQYVIKGKAKKSPVYNKKVQVKKFKTP
jgi:hypothetical protein